MRLRHLQYLCLAPAALLAACATNTPPHAYLPDAARDKIASTEVVVPVRQSEIYVYVPPSTSGTQAGAAFGMLGVLVGAMVDTSVNNSRTSKAETAVKPLRDAIVDYNFDAALKDDVGKSLTQVGIAHVGNVRVAKEVTPEAMDAALTGSTDAAVLFTTADYHLSNDANQLSVVVTAMMFPNSDALRAVQPAQKTKTRTDAKNAIYRNTFMFQADVPGTVADRDHNIQVWSADNGAAMRADLTFAEQKLAQMVADDITATEAGDKARSEEAVKEDGVDVKLVSTDSDGHTVRFKDGTLKYLKK